MVVLGDAHVLVPIVDQPVVGARGWSASGWTLGQLYLDVGEVGQVVLTFKVGQQRGAPAQLIGGGLVLVLLLALGLQTRGHYGVGADIELVLKLSGNGLEGEVLSLLPLQGRDVEGLGAGAPDQGPHILHIHPEVDAHQLLLVDGAFGGEPFGEQQRGRQALLLDWSRRLTIFLVNFDL